jgi:hypothetical protein
MSVLHSFSKHFLARLHACERGDLIPDTTDVLKSSYSRLHHINRIRSLRILPGGPLPISCYTQTYRWNGAPLYQWGAIFINLLYQWVDNISIYPRHLSH